MNEVTNIAFKTILTKYGFDKYYFDNKLRNDKISISQFDKANNLQVYFTLCRNLLFN